MHYCVKYTNFTKFSFDLVHELKNLLPKMVTLV